LLGMGLPPTEVDQIMGHLTGLVEERGRAGFTKHRNDLDLDIPITTKTGDQLSLVDLMDQDMESVLQRYRRSVSGQASLARKGIRSRRELDQMLSALRTEQESLGEEAIPTDMLKAMFSEFQGGP